MTDDNENCPCCKLPIDERWLFHPVSSVRYHLYAFIMNLSRSTGKSTFSIAVSLIHHIAFTMSVDAYDNLTNCGATKDDMLLSVNNYHEYFKELSVLAVEFRDK